VQDCWLGARACSAFVLQYHNLPSPALPAPAVAHKLQAAASRAEHHWQAAALRILEALVAAGFRPTLYCNVRIRPQGANWPSWGHLAPWLDTRYPHQHWLSTPLLPRFDPFDFHRQHPLSRQGPADMQPAAPRLEVGWQLAAIQPQASSPCLPAVAAIE
jgi:hypothetical protein